MFYSVLALWGIFLFFVIHLIPSLPKFREALIIRFGEYKYKGIFTFIAGTGMCLMIFAKSSAKFTPVWWPPNGIYHLALIIMPISIYLQLAAYCKSNIKRITNHPLLWGVALWAAVHLVTNGDLSSIIFFGGFLFFAWAKIRLINLREKEIARTTVKVPFKIEILLMVVSLLIFFAILFFHKSMFGVPVPPLPFK